MAAEAGAIVTLFSDLCMISHRLQQGGYKIWVRVKWLAVPRCHSAFAICLRVAIIEITQCDYS